MTFVRNLVTFVVNLVTFVRNLVTCVKNLVTLVRNLVTLSNTLADSLVKFSTRTRTVISFWVTLALLLPDSLKVHF